MVAVFGPVRLNDSQWNVWVWLDQFARELAGGTLNPRWLPLSHGGLGSPVFYYYPPLAFYLGSIFVWMGIPVYQSLSGICAAGYLASGIGMYLWLKGQVRRPLFGAFIYMAAPYHAYDFYSRGAVAEFVGVAVIPFAMLGLRRLSSGARRGFAITAVSYAALICSHLPLALLASLFLLGPYAALLVFRSPARVIPVAAAFATGILLSAIYLVPALALQPFRDASLLWSDPFLQPQTWSVWNLHPPPSRGTVLIAATLAICLAATYFVRRSGWAIFGIGCAIVGSGAIPWVWAIPPLQLVQFPYRIFPLAEFALATALARVSRPLLLALFSMPLVALTVVVMAWPLRQPDVSMEQLRSTHPDVPENLPPGERPATWPSQWALDLAATHRTPQTKDGITVEPVFYFPSWRVDCGGHRVPTFAAPETKLLAHPESNCSRRIGLTPPEIIGGLLSALALLILLLASARDAIRPKGAGPVELDG